MQSLRWTGGIVSALLLAASPCAAQQVMQAGNIPIETYRLPNGLRVVLSQDRSVPVVAVDVWYDVGSRNERPGRSGFAHLFEHMMFQGSQNVGKTEHLQLVQRAGGSMNGSTTEDRTNYFETLPSNRLNLGLWLEADRMRSLAITPENLENQREVVKEERRLRIDNQPYGSSFLASSYEVPYAESCYAYDHSVIGSMDDLNAAQINDVQDFFGTYYAPNNATLTVVGDFDQAAATAMIEEYFGGIPSGPPAPAVECQNPFSHLPVRETIQDSNASVPAWFASYGMPSVESNDIYALTLLGNILGSGESSRLYQRLVKTEKVAAAVSAGTDVRRGPGLFTVFGIPVQGIGVDRIQTLVDEEIARVRERGVTADELVKAKNSYRARTVLSRQTALGKAEELQFAKHFYGDPNAVNTVIQKYLAVTQDDIRRVANQYLIPKNRAVVVTQPAAAAQGAAQ